MMTIGDIVSDVASDLKLNLGSFDDYVKYLPKGAPAQFSINLGSSVRFFVSHDGEIVDTKIIDDTVNIPLFEVGGTSKGCLSHNDNTKKILAIIELEIFNMIRQIYEKDCYSLLDDRLVVVVKNVAVYDSDTCDECYGWAEVGVATLQEGRGV